SRACGVAQAASTPATRTASQLLPHLETNTCSPRTPLPCNGSTHVPPIPPRGKTPPPLAAPAGASLDSNGDDGRGSNASREWDRANSFLLSDQVPSRVPQPGAPSVPSGSCACMPAACALELIPVAGGRQAPSMRSSRTAAWPPCVRQMRLQRADG